MSDVVIKVENLSKQYRIGSKEAYKTFRETLIDSAKAPFLRLAGVGRKFLNSMPYAPLSKHAEGISQLSAPSSDHAEGISPLSAVVSRRHHLGP